MPISFSLYDAYVISVVSVWPVAMIVAGVAQIAAFRFFKSRRRALVGGARRRPVSLSPGLLRFCGEKPPMGIRR
ncbi:hypothetical protein At1D1460_51360 (plasmid) [Agrobacterium tumefaciens]|nr:hypothetical protein At1D1460_51360 [Agrobacterium tumefaciens]